ncbi:hypothetical protein AB0F17_56825 [Nonomuraea sp. NPDC026600]|uniref:hypothetical protein n=1 Tax=Nonomuraea sp. NPDC026600 TaxID=3155363 RepID=UPI0033DC4F45
MVVFACTGCGAVLTARVSQVALPDHAGQKYGHDLLPALLEPGTYAVDPGDGHPWQPWEVEAEGPGVFRQMYTLSGAPGRIGVAPGDVRRTMFIPERYGGCCCGWDGRYGPNLACAACECPVATRVDDCGFWQVVWLDPGAVRPVAVDGPACRVVGWEALREVHPGIPLIEQPGWWSLEWMAAIAVALAHLLAVSGGKRVIVPEGLAAEALRWALDTLLPPGPPERRLVLTGPGLAAEITDIAMVPRHPQTGEVWPCSGEAVVPLAADVWTYMAFNDDRQLAHAAARMPADVRRDDSPPLLPNSPFRPDWEVFLRTLERLPLVSQPWLREIYDRVKDRRYTGSFL